MTHPVITGLDHVVLRVRDPGRAQEFYCTVLGCTVEVFQRKIGLLQLRAGDSLIDLVQSEMQEGRNMDHFCLRVVPFDPAAISEHLRTHGVEPGEVVQRYGAEGSGPSIYISDPDGNTVELKGPATSKEKPKQ